jgi:hypothetical protein
VVVIKQEQVLVLSDLQQAGPKQLPGVEIEGIGCFLLEPVSNHLIGPSSVQGFGPQGKGRWRVKELQNLFPNHPERGTQRGMAFDQISQRLLEGGHVQRTCEPPEERQVIGGELGFELVQKIQARLGKGSRERLATGGPIPGQWLGGWDGGR